MNSSPITRINPVWLLNMVSGSVDMTVYHDYCHDPSTCECEREAWGRLLNRKFNECSKAFIELLERDFTHPICVQVKHDGSWVIGNGNHRFAVALFRQIPEINVIFAFDGDWMHTDITDPRYGKADGITSYMY